MSNIINRQEEPLLRVRGLRTQFTTRRGVLQRASGLVRAVDGVDLTIYSGRTLALVGESGSGKTTLGLSVLRLVAPTDGEIWFKGKNLLTMPKRALHPYRKALQIVWQDTSLSLDPGLTVGEIVAEGLDAFGLCTSSAERRKRVTNALELVGLDRELAERFPDALSGGQRQRVGIARALAVEPELIVCDEATSSLDVSSQAEIVKLLRELQSRLHIAYLFITHDLSLASQFAHDVAVMYCGQIVEEGSVADVLLQPAHPYTRALLAAMPSTDPARRRIEVRASGEIPSPLHPPAGCRYHPRCVDTFGPCPERVPDVYELGRRRVRCFLWESTDRTEDTPIQQGQREE